MFGHENGAFTGAIAQRIGRFELAHRGTMFLDEVGEIPLELQTKLLRVLQEREFERLGSSRTIRTDARLVAATNRDLAEMVEERAVPRRPLLPAQRFSHHRPAAARPPRRHPAAGAVFRAAVRPPHEQADHDHPRAKPCNALARYHWPGNIRELQNFIERAVIVSPGPALQAPIRELKRDGGRRGSADPGRRGAGSDRARFTGSRRQGRRRRRARRRGWG